MAPPFIIIVLWPGLPLRAFEIAKNSPNLKMLDSGFICVFFKSFVLLKKKVLKVLNVISKRYL